VRGKRSETLEDNFRFDFAVFVLVNGSNALVLRST
jgi:hypothetical protein